MIVTIHAMMINTNDINIPSLFVKKSVPNIDMIANTKNANIPPISSQINVFPAICHPPGFCGSLTRDIRDIRINKYYIQARVLSVVFRDDKFSSWFVLADMIIISPLL